MNNFNQSFRVHQDNPEASQSGYLNQQESSTLRKPLRILSSEQNMGLQPITLEEALTKIASESSVQHSTSTSKPSPTNLFQFTKFPLEVQEQVIKEFIHISSPQLSILKEKPQLPLTQDLNQQAKPSTLLDHTISYEFEDSLYPLLLVSKTWYHMVAAYMIRKSVFIDGPFNVQRLLLFEKRLNGFGFQESAEDSTINNSMRSYTFGMKYYLASEGKTEVGGWTTDEIAGTFYCFDCYGEGPWWKRPDSVGLDKSMADIYQVDEESESWDWFSIPGWVRGGSPNIGGHLNYQSEDGLTDKDSSINGSIFKYGSIIENRSVERDESARGGSGFVKNSGSGCYQNRIGMGTGINRLNQDKINHEPGSFLTYIKTLILGPGASEIHRSDSPHYISSLTRGLPQDSPDASLAATYYPIPGTYLLSKMFSRQELPTGLKNLVISGHIWANPWFFLPRPIESDLRFPNLTTLTLSLPHISQKQSSPMRTLRYFRDKCADRHLCTLLTGRHKMGDESVIEEGSTFLNTLEYLHIRGPGAHCCSELFKGNWKKLQSVIIELPTTAAICESSTKRLITTIEETFLECHPKSKVQINLRAVMAWFDSDFRHYFWRRMKDNLQVTESYPGSALPLAISPNGINVTLFSKPNEDNISTCADSDWIAAIDNIQQEEELYTDSAIEYFMFRDGVDARTMVWSHDHIWTSVEEAATKLAIKEENTVVSEDEEEPDYELLRHVTDVEFVRQNCEYVEHFVTLLKQDFPLTTS